MQYHRLSRRVNNRTFFVGICWSWIEYLMKSQKLPKYRRKTRNLNSFETLRPVDNETSGLIEIKEGYPDTISFCMAAYFRFEVATSISSKKFKKGI
jgi:hypothetical protein